MFKGVTSLFEQPITLISALLSCFSILKKSVEIMQFAYSRRRLEGFGTVCMVTAIALLTFFLATLILMKLYFIEACESHKWEFSAGCLDMD